ncbi:MAG: glycoside hydrolase [Alistipes sp.]|nr:glycoside hydrolase [Alistipes sp.]
MTALHKLTCKVALSLLLCASLTPQLQAQDASTPIAFATQREAWLQKAAANMPQLSETHHAPQQIVRSVQDPQAFQGWRMEASGEPIDSLYTQSFKARKTVILDFGEHLTGYFTFRVNHMGLPADAPIRFRFTFAEMPAELNTPFDPYPGGLSRAWLQDEIVSLMRLPETLTLSRRLACRYVKIELLAQSYFDFTFEKIDFKAVTSATQRVEPLDPSTDPRIARINDVGLTTLKECMQTVYEDGPKRDQRLWIGDLYLESLANTYSYQNHQLTRRCLYLLAALADEEGWLHATVYEYPTPLPQTHQHCMDYSLLYGVALNEYYKATGDRETAEDLWPVVVRQIGFARTYLKDDIYDMQKQPSWWLVFDWKDQLDRHASMQGLMTFALDQSYELARLLGREKEVSEWPNALKAMRKASRKCFYDARNGVVRSGAEGQISHLSQVWMILSKTLTPKEGQRALELVLSDSTACYPGSPYAYHYLIEALIECGMDDQARELLISYWGGMVENGADTFWEVYDPKDDFKSPYNFFPINSYCHAWSCTPVYFIHKYKSIFQR